MKDKIRGVFIGFVLFFPIYIFASNLEYTLIKKGQDDNNTMLVFGGIQGDEPGGFLAASLLSTDYKIENGSVWVVPNLNFPSIIRRSRGLNGDMNRKFSSIDGKDPDYTTVTHIKKLIIDPQVALIVNLHDGSGFYREQYIDKYFNPYRWGNSCIIDQVELQGVRYGNLKQIADLVAEEINKHIQDEKHRYHVKNTRTREGDIEMLKSLTFYAIENKKAAFANEASKSLRTHERVYYHLVALEKYMDLMGIKYTRGFELTPKGVKDVINKGVEISLYGNKIYLNLDNPRSLINYVPMPKKKPIDFKASNPLTAVVKDGKSFAVHYGNRKLTKLVPQYFDYTPDLESIEVTVDGYKQLIPIGSLVKVGNFFKVAKNQNQRVNVIGYTNKKYKNEAEIEVRHKEILKRYSIDQNARIFRVEIYDTTKSEKGTFAGMFLVEFDKDAL